ncbi:putative reverse transcriptase domain-containing protein [Tanacetum coccineum]
MNYIPVSLENQTNPHTGTSEVTNSTGTLQTPNANASEEEDEDEELIVVPTADRQVGTRKSSTNSKAEEFLTELQNLILHCMSPKSGGWDQFGSNLATALICLSTGRIYNFSKLIFDGMVANLKSKSKFLMYLRFLQMILEIQTQNKHPYLAIVLTKKIFGNMKRGFRGVPRPLLPAILPVVAVDQSAGTTDQAEDQPSSSAPLPSSSHPPVISGTIASEPTPVAEPTTHHTSPSPEHDNEPTEHFFEQPSPEHQPISPRQETAVPQSQDPTHPHVPEARPMIVEDLLHLVPNLITKIDSLETELKQTKLTMGKAIVKLVKKVKKLEDMLKRRHVVLTDSEDEECNIPYFQKNHCRPGALRRKSVRKDSGKRVSGSTNTGGTVVPEMHGCLYQTFMNGKPHSFKGTEGVVGLKRWFEKMEQVFEICKCAEDDKVKFAIIKGNITFSKPATLHEAINMARELVEQSVQGRAVRIEESNKRKWEDNQRNNNNNNHNYNNNHNNNNNRNRNNNHHQQQNRRPKTVRAYAAAPARGKIYAGNLPKCNRCNLHHHGPCPQKCQRCQRIGHMEKDCRVRLQGAGNDFLQNVTCFGCGEKGHFKDKCTFLLNDHYACIHFDSGAEKSFVSSAFTHFIDIAPATLNTSYEIELADGKVVSTNTILPLIDCYEKIVRIPLLNGKILEVQGERPEKDLRLFACIKADEKKLDDIRVVRDFPKVFPDNLLALPIVREIEFRIDLILGASLVVRSLYRLAPSEMLELSNSLKNFKRRVLFDQVTHHGEHPCSLSRRNTSEEEHKVHLKTILDLLKKEKLYAKFSKYEFWLQEVQFLGHVVNRDGFHVDPSKVKSVKNWMTPESPTEIRSFLGLAGYYRRFIENFYKIAKPLTLLTQKNKAYTKILEAQSKASKDLKAPSEWLRGLERHFEQRDDGEIYFFDRIWIPSVGDVRKLIMDKTHTSRYLVHPGADKMYYDLSDLYWWPCMKRDIAEYINQVVTSYYSCAETKQKREKDLAKIYVNKIERDMVYQLSIISDRGWNDVSRERTIQTLEDMLRAYVMDFGGSWDAHLPLIEFSYNNNYHTSINLLDQKICANKTIYEKIVQIKKRLKTARSCQKSYADKRRKPLEFQVRDRVFLKVSPWKRVVRFGKKGKLAPRYVGPYEIVERVVPVPLDEIEIDENLCFVKEPIEIVERDVKKLNRRRILLVKVHWNSWQGAEYTWEHEDQFRKKYLNFFSEPVPSSGVAT